MMKRLTAMLLALVMIFAVTVSASAQTAGMVNPRFECATAEEVYALSGVMLYRPAVMGVTDISYAVIDATDCLIAECRYELNGTPWCMRAAKNTTEDISGVYLVGGSAFTGEKQDETEYVIDDTIKLARWFSNETQYVLMQDDGTVSTEVFMAATEEMKAAHAAAAENAAPVDLMALCGVYQDAWSQRAMAEVSLAPEGNALQVIISWGDSAFVTYVWQMTCTLEANGILRYNDCVNTRETYSEDGKVTRDVISEHGEGYLVVKDNGTICWEGADEDNAKECRFERVVW